MRYEPQAINFHLGETPPREPQGGGEQTESAARADFMRLSCAGLTRASILLAKELGQRRDGPAGQARG